MESDSHNLQPSSETSTASINRDQTGRDQNNNVTTGDRAMEQTKEDASSVKVKRKNKSEPRRTKVSKKPAGQPMQNLKPTSEEMGSFLENIKTEWHMFWAGIVGDDEKDVEVSKNGLLSEDKNDFPDAFVTGKLQVLSIEQVKLITRALSQDRKKINQRIEQIHREIELNSERLESIKLVGGDVADTIDEINKLNDLGMKLSLQLEKVSQQLDRFRSREDELKGLR